MGPMRRESVIRSEPDPERALPLLPLEGDRCDPTFLARGRDPDLRHNRIPADEEDTMTPDERKLLSDLFERIRGAAAAPRDREAEEMIAEAVRAQPYSPYLLAQTVLVQEEGLRAAASRIQELEAQLAERESRQEEGGSFLGGLGKSIFGSSEPGRPTSVPRTGAPAWNAPPAAPQPGGPWGRGPAPSPGFGGGQPGFGAAGSGFGGGQAFGGGGRGGFLSGALSTAAGVAGGALLFQGISSLFSSAHAASPVAQSMADPAALGEATGVNDVFNSIPGAEGEKAIAAAQDASANDASADDAPDDDPMVDDASYDDGGFDSGGDDGGDWA